MTSRSERITVICALSLPLLGCAPKEYTAFQPDRAKWLEADQEAAANAKEMKEPAILPKTYYAAGQLFEQQGQVQKAIFQYQRAIALQQDYVPAYNRMGVLWGRLGQHTEAEDALRKAVGMRPDWAYLRNNLGYEYMLQERWADAEGELRTALRLKPDFARAHNNLGVVLAKLGRYDEALAEFKEAMPESDALYNLGMMYKNQNRYPEAAGAFERAVGLAPQFDEARTQLAVVAPGSDWQAPRQQPVNAYAQPYTAVAARPMPSAVEIEPISTYPSPGLRTPAPAAPSIVAVDPVPVMSAQAPAAKDDSTAIAWQVPTEVRVAEDVIEAPVEIKVATDPTVLIVEARNSPEMGMQAPALAEIIDEDPCGSVEQFAVIESEMEPFYSLNPAADEPCIDEIAPLTEAVVTTEVTAVDFDDPCVADTSEDADVEPIESFAELAEEISDAQPTVAPAWEGRFSVISWLRYAIFRISAAETAAVSASIGPAIEPFLFEAFEAEPVVTTEENLAVLCDFSTDGVAHFEPAADWRELSNGFDASIAFLSLVRGDGVVEELEASSALSMVIVD